ncbi:Cof-type HAD-IIB family hydrolase [Marinicrinis sediminis]|uniref:Cof-type HAD-IIB family hydrolase n=1 Tax=Marinicrinis sediminis TaxID=1652465 RepID=A0ABW5R6N7_9BACL
MDMAYKLLALDMDGTLLTEEKTISNENKAWLKRAEEAGVTVCLSTGRGIFSIEPYLEELQLLSPIVTVNGSEVWEAPGKLLERHEMKIDWIRELREIALKHDVWYWAYSTEGVYNQGDWREEPETATWLKFGYYIEDLDTLKQVHERVRDMDLFEITNSHPCNLEMNPPGVSKASGLQSICRLLGLDMSQVIAVGDSLNDLAMIHEAGLGVAMGNAQESVKVAADFVTLDNEQDGVAEVVKKYIVHPS